MFCKESLGKSKFRAFLKRVGPLILSLESIDYFGTSEHFSGRKKKKKNLIISKTSIVSVVNFHNCMQMSLLAMFEMTHHHSVLITFFISGNDVISLESRPLNFCVIIQAYSLRLQMHFQLLLTHVLNQFRNKLLNMI